MNRRQYLARTGAAGVSTGLIASLAGCLDGFSDSSDGSDVDVSDRTGQRALDRAAGSLNKAAQSLEQLEGLEDPETVEFDPAPPRGHLETAESELGDDRAADITTLRSYASVLDGLISVTVTVTDDTLDDDIDAVNAALEDEGDLEGANETVDARYEKIAGARDRHAEATATIAAIDGDRLDELAGIDLADLESGAATLGDVVTALETLAGSYDATLDEDEGYGALESGQSHVDNGEYEAAQTEFETAESTFSTSLDRLETGRTDAPDGLIGYFDTATCQNRHLTDAAAAFADAAAAAANNDPDARIAQSESEAELDAVGNCTD
ncbi:hypothetical protein E2L06_01095 [Haloterrigena sp. H1]|uniref:hypothetical protein n=1 Tax=Haloterrigena sp. H1 TaxID=2552943 RepID=UPI00110F208F|nr:hypothetical protein [Haloterrigena sp. H1]TMT85273.1 hypothetical protein E2L06_01095 [Haloterrigena sp. H1]